MLPATTVVAPFAAGFAHATANMRGFYPKIWASRPSGIDAYTAPKGYHIAFIDWASLPHDTATAMFFFYNAFRDWADTTLASSGSGALNNFGFGPPYYRSFTFYIGGQSQYISASTEELYVTRVGIAPNGSLWPTHIINFRAPKTLAMGSSKAFATQAGYGRLP